MKTETISLLSQISRKFCESTSLHGYSYIANTNLIIMKIMWSVLILCLSAIGVKFLVVNTHEYMESRLVTSIESSSASLKVRNIFPSFLYLLSTKPVTKWSRAPDQLLGV